MSKNTNLAELINYISVSTESGVEVQIAGGLKQTAVTSSILKASSSGVLVSAIAGTDFQAPLTGTGFVKSTAGVISYDTNTYLTGNQSITVSGDATGSGTTAIALTLANSGVTAGTYRSVTVDAKGRVTAGTNPTTISGYGITDLLAQLLTGYVVGTNTALAATDSILGAFQKLQGQVNARLSANQTITLSGDASGSGTTAITVTLANSGATAGTYGSSSAIPVVTVDAKGRVTSISTSAVSIVSALSGLSDVTITTPANGQLLQYNSTSSKWVNWTPNYITGNQSITISGDATGSGATSIAVTLVNSGVTAGTYTKVTVDAKGRVTSGASLASGDLPTYTGTLTSSQVTTALGYTPYNSSNPNGYITSSADISGYSARLFSSDVRTIAPNSHPAYRITAGFTSWNNNSGSPYADYIHFRSYSDSSGGNDNLLMFRKDALGIRIWQQTFGSATAYSSYKDIAWTDGTNASGTWNISISGNAATASSVAWTNVSGRPTAVSSFTNDSGYITSSSLSAYLALSGGTMTGQILTPSTGSDVYGGAIQIRERGYVLAAQSDWSYSPAITFHWGNRAAIRFGLKADGNMAVDNNALITAANIGSQSVNYATTAGSANSVAWTNVSGRPTAVSSFTNDSGYITSSGSITGSAGSVAWGNITGRPTWMTSASLIATHSNANDWQNSGFYENGGGGSNWPSATWYNSINVRHSNQGNYHGFQVAMSYYDNLLWFRSYQGSGTFQSWVYAISSANIGSQSVNYATSAGSANSVAWTNVSGRPTALSSFTNDSGYITSGGRAYPRRSDGGDLNFYWSGQSGQPSWLWGGNDGANMYVYNPSNFSVNYATTAGSAPANGGTSSYVTINYNNDSNSTYQMLWGSGNGVYGTGGIYCNPATDTIYATQFVENSSIRFKYNVEGLQNSLSKVLGMRGVSYKRIGTDIEEIGVIAEEMVEIIPQVVKYENGEIEGVNYSRLTAVLIESIKEQQKQINELKNLLNNK